jgi:hypothetical protein
LPDAGDGAESLCDKFANRKTFPAGFIGEIREQNFRALVTLESRISFAGSGVEPVGADSCLLLGGPAELCKMQKQNN